MSLHFPVMRSYNSISILYDVIVIRKILYYYNMLVKCRACTIRAYVLSRTTIKSCARYNNSEHCLPRRSGNLWISNIIHWPINTT